eukprot:9739881-Heterocapsa_arctica.AAC.1
MARGLGGPWSPQGLPSPLKPHPLAEPEDVPFLTVHKENFVVYCNGCDVVYWKNEVGINGQCADCHNAILRNIFHSTALHQDWKNKGSGNIIIPKHDVYRTRAKLMCKQVLRVGNPKEKQHSPNSSWKDKALE